MASSLTVELDNRTCTKEIAVEYPHGSPKHPGTLEAVERKPHKNLGLLFPSGTVQQIVRVVSVENETPVKDFVDLLWKGS